MALQAPYVPVADPQWVYKVVNLALKDISKKKLVLGVATYGYEYSVTPFSGYGYSYKLQWAFNPKYASDIAAQYGATIQHNRAGEQSFVYIPNLFPNSPPPGTTPANLSNNDTVPVTATNGSGKAGAIYNILWWSDASAINDKINIAKELGLRGIAIFKIDGGEDPALWNLLP
jgi:spore germination protein YaaH